MKRLLRQPQVQAALARLFGCYLDFALRTTRWRLDGMEHLAPLAVGCPHVVAFWHERLPLMPILWVLLHRLPHARSGVVPGRVHVLVSRHRDGRFIGAVMRRFRIDVVIGSSSRGGAAGLLNLLRLLHNGDLVSITPDGPRGPRRVAAPGVARLAALSGVPVLPCAAQTSRHWVLGTWDRMVVPKPFGRGIVVCGPKIAVAREGWGEAAAIGAALTDAAERADRLCEA